MPQNIPQLIMRIIGFTVFIVSITAFVSRIPDWPNYPSLPQCAKQALGFIGVFSVLHCNVPVCVCDRYSEGLSIVESLAATKFNCPASGVSSATSVLSGFCHQLP